MAARYQDVEEIAMQLKSQDRARLASVLVASIGTIEDPAEVDAAWRDTILRRQEAVRNGKLELVPAADAIAAAREAITRDR